MNSKLVSLALYPDDRSMRKPSKSDLAKTIEVICEEVHILTSNEGQTVISSMAFIQCENKAMFYSFDDLGKIIPTVERKTWN